MKRSLFINFSYYTHTFLLGAYWLRFPFPKLQTFSGIFWVLAIDYSLYGKAMLGIFVYLFICEVTTTKVNFPFYKQHNKPQYVLFAKELFLCKMLVCFLGSNIPLYIEKGLVEKLCKVPEMELKTPTSADPKFVFKKIKFKFSHYIELDFIGQRPKHNKDQTGMFKSLVINQLQILKYF